MQKEAYKITGFTAVVSAFGFMLRWLQNMKIIDTETGLAARMQPISWFVALLIVAVAGVLFGFIYYYRRYDAPLDPIEALTPHTFIFTAAGFLCALLLCYAGIAEVVKAGDQMWPVFHRLCGMAKLVGALGVILFVTGVGKAEKAATRRAGSAMVVVFGCFWLVTAYKVAASDPVIWHFAIEILGVCAALVAFYYMAGYQFEEPKPFAAVFSCYFGAFLCIVSAIDEHPTYESVSYAAVAILLLSWGFTLVENLRRANRSYKLDEEIVP